MADPRGDRAAPSEVALGYHVVNHAPRFGSSLPLDEHLTAAAAAGFAGVALDTGSIDRWIGEGGTLGSLSRLLARLGLACHEVAALRLVEPASALEQAVQLARTAEALGSEWVVAVVLAGGGEPIVEVLGEAAERIAGHGARLAIEFLPWSPVSTLAEARAIVAAAGGPARAACLVDTWHVFHGGASLEELAALPLDEIGLVHFNDAQPPRGDDLRYESTERRTLPGLGHLDLAAFVGVVRAKGYTGIVDVEVLSGELRRRDIRAVTAEAYARTRPFWR